MQQVWLRSLKLSFSGTDDRDELQWMWTDIVQGVSSVKKPAWSQAVVAMSKDLEN